MNFQLSKLKSKLSPYGAFAKNSTILFLGTMIASLLNYLFHVAIGRFVSTEIYGEAEALISLTNIISVPAMTLTMVATKYAAFCSAKEDRIGSYEILSYLNRKIFLFGFPIFLLAVILTPFIGDFLNIENRIALVILWIAMLLSFFAAITSGILRGWQKYADISSSGIWGAAIKLVFGIILVKIGFDLGGIMGSIALGAVASYLVTVLSLRSVHAKKGKSVKVEEGKLDLKDLRNYILPAFVGNLAITILGNGDMVIAKHILEPVGAGQYGALTVVSKIIFFATGIIATVLFSMSAENSQKGQSSNHIFKIALIAVFLASGIATLIYFIYPGLVLGLVFGHKYQEVTAYLGWFAVSVSIFSIINVIFQYLLSMHRTKISYLFMLAAIIMLGMEYFYGKSIGSIIGIVIAMQIVAIIISFFFLSARKKIDKTL